LIELFGKFTIINIQNTSFEKNSTKIYSGFSLLNTYRPTSC
jgi:hypothetical protein